jgi:PAT family acetyl-CoA transporter-like MFS transporter 1
MPIMIGLLLTFGFGFSATEGMTNLKLIERQVPKEKIAMLSIPMIPVKILITLFLTR